ncbi:MAG: hypothetical protein FJ207_05740 [Gemmatimonadetes bacterium]|nr:hypothetical protein [Gemmatimonadota bacterium]
MRLLLRFMLAGPLIASCTFDWADGYETPVTPCTMVPDTTFQIGYGADSLTLAVGAVTGLAVEWGVASCEGYQSLALTGVVMTGPDSAVAMLMAGPEWLRPLLGVAPGRTRVGAQFGAYRDSLLVTVPDTVPMDPVAFVAAGESVSCAVDVGGVARCWGGSAHLFLGAAGPCSLGLCTPMPVARITGARSVYVGRDHACTLDAFGRAQCWGSNEWGKLGSSSGGGVPIAVTGDVLFSTLSLGASHSCGLDTEGAAYYWGVNELGRLGAGPMTQPASAPWLVTGGHTFASLASGSERTCAVTDLQTVRCWGTLGPVGLSIAGATTCTLALGKAGTYTATCATAPVSIPLADALGADTLFASVGGSCALTTFGSVYCYDSAPPGRLRRQALFGPFVSVVGGERHHCALDATRAAWCRGDNSDGQLGDGSTLRRTIPSAVAGGHAFTQLAAGRTHTCGLTTASDVWCWGSNSEGQLGVSMVDTRSSVPRRVRSQR